jgi:phenylacetate-CoA ligase
MLAAADKDGSAEEPWLASRAALDALVAERLAALAARLRSAGNRTRYAGASLADQPILDGGALAAEIDAHPPFGRLQLAAAPLIRAGLSTAGVPRPIPVAWTQADLDREARLGARALRRAGLVARGRSSDCLEGGLVCPGTLAVTDALDALDALALPVGPITGETALRRAAEVWGIVQPTVLIVDAPSLEFLRQASGYQRPRVFAVLLTPNDAGVLGEGPAADVYRVLSVPQLATFTAGECAEHRGLHLAEDEIHAEIVDPSGRAVAPGTRGRLLLTSLTRSVAVVRFDTGLHARLDAEPCGCGEASARLHFAG